MKRTSKSCGRMTVKLRGIDPHSHNFTDEGRIRSIRRARAQSLNRAHELFQGKALARARRPEKTDRKRGLGAPMQHKLGEDGKMRAHSKRIGSIGKACGKDPLKLRDVTLPARRASWRRQCWSRLIRPDQPLAGNDRSKIRQSDISQNPILYEAQSLRKWSSSGRIRSRMACNYVALEAESIPASI
jgi:hypothetical protein